ncbi:MAG: hypothetical protein M3355_00965 [Actinomycetota bacterium]|nr:hypothetical protein [Actinomycetota bacterium]
MPEDEQSFPAGDNRPIAQFGNLVANVGGRIQEILDTAERIAGEIQADAEAAGATYLQDRQREADRVVQERMAALDAITQLLTARSASMERETTAFVAEVEQVRWRMARLIGDDGPPAEPATGDQLASGAASQSPEATGRGVSQAAALRATQMAVAGAERAEIERMLRDQFGIDDPLGVDGVLRTGGA